MIDESLHAVKGKELILLAKKCFKYFYHTSFLKTLINLDRNDFNNWLCKLNVIIGKLDIKL